MKSYASEKYKLFLFLHSACVIRLLKYSLVILINPPLSSIIVVWLKIKRNTPTRKHKQNLLCVCVWKTISG